MNAPRRALAAVLLLAPAARARAAAEDPLAACAAAVASRPDDLASYRCYHRLARREGRLAAPAAQRLERLLFRDARNDGARLALAAVEADRFRDRAEPLFAEAATGFAARRQARGEVLARTGLSFFLRSRGRREDAAAQVERAREVAAASGDATLLARVRVFEAMATYGQGDYGRAARVLDEIEETVFAAGEADLQSTWLSARGFVCWAIGQHDRALAHYQRQVEVCRRAGDRYDEAVALGNVIFINGVLRMGPEPRLALSRELLGAAIAGGNRLMEARAHEYLGQLTEGTQRRAHFARFLSLARQTRDVRLTVMALRGLAVELAADRPAEAFRLMDEADGLARGVGDLADIARTRVMRARLRWRAGPRAGAIADSRRALDSIEATRHLQPDNAVRARRFMQWGGVYNEFVSHVLSGDLGDSSGGPTPEDLELAFSMTERRQAGILLDEMDAAQATPAVGAQGPAARRRTEALKAIAAVQKRLVTVREEGPRREAQRELEQLEREEEAARVELARSEPAFGVLRPARLASLADVQRALGQDEALLSFHVWYRGGPAGRSWVFVQTKEGTRVHAVANAEEETLGLFLGLVDRRDGSEAAGAARLYHDLLEEPLRDLPARVTRLVVVVDGVLQQLAFDLLRPSPQAEPLGARYEITTVTSATLWLRLRSAVHSRAEIPALVLADPDLAPAGESPAAEREWALAMGARLGRLPQARREGRDIARQLRGSRLLEGPEATERFVKQADLRRFGILHVAAHGLIDYEKPDRSAVLLTPGAPDEDGLLQVRELVGLDLQGRVVVLSSCRSASGKPLFEGVMGLPRALFLAGATTVVASLWPLRDDEAALLFRGFYRSLARGNSVAAALAQARRERIRAGAPAASWAGLVVLGDGSVVPFPGGQTASRGWGLPLPLPLVTTAVLLLLAALAATWARVRRTRGGRRS